MKNSELKPPVSFQGGKQKVSKMLSDIVFQEDTQYIDLCCGSGAVSIGLINKGVHPENITMVDASDWGTFWSQVSEGTFDTDYFNWLIDSIPEDKDKIKPYLESIAKEGYDPETESDIIPIWLILQAGSFGGKHIWSDNGAFRNASFRNYWKPTPTSSRRSPVNPMMPMPQTLLKQTLKCVEEMSPVKAVNCRVENFNWKHYEKVRTKSNVVVFIDPPYEDTTGYGFKLDYKKWLENLELPENYSLYITDYQKHSETFWELSKTSKGGISGGNKKRVEILSKVK